MIPGTGTAREPTTKKTQMQDLETALELKIVFSAGRSKQVLGCVGEREGGGVQGATEEEGEEGYGLLHCIL